MNPTRQVSLRYVFGATFLVVCTLVGRNAAAQVVAPTVVDPRLDVRTAASGVRHAGQHGVPRRNENVGPGKEHRQGPTRCQCAIVGTAIDLAVNNNSERGLLGIALHPNFPAMPFVYLYWTCRTAAPPTDQFQPSAEHCDDALMLGTDSGTVRQVRFAGTASIDLHGTERRSPTTAI
jgi:hypothetical protein